MNDSLNPATSLPTPTDEITWPDTTGLTPEAANLADAQALVDAEAAEWIDELPAPIACDRCSPPDASGAPETREDGS